MSFEDFFHSRFLSVANSNAPAAPLIAAPQPPPQQSSAAPPTNKRKRLTSASADTPNTVSAAATATATAAVAATASASAVVSTPSLTPMIEVNPSEEGMPEPSPPSTSTVNAESDPPTVSPIAAPPVPSSSASSVISIAPIASSVGMVEVDPPQPKRSKKKKTDHSIDGAGVEGAEPPPPKPSAKSKSKSPKPKASKQKPARKAKKPSDVKVDESDDNNVVSQPASGLTPSAAALSIVTPVEESAVASSVPSQSSVSVSVVAQSTDISDLFWLKHIKTEIKIDGSGEVKGKAKRVGKGGSKSKGGIINVGDGRPLSEGGSGVGVGKYSFIRPTAEQRAKALGPQKHSKHSTNDRNWQCLTQSIDRFFAAVPVPSSDDWLFNQSEQSQSFDDWFYGIKHLTKNRIIYLLPIGSFSDSQIAPQLSVLQSYCAVFFQCETRVLPRLEDTLEQQITSRIGMNGQKQYLTLSVYPILKKFKPADAFCCVGVTMCDLYPEESWNFVFGQAFLRELIGVFSFARYDPSFYAPKSKASRSKQKQTANDKKSAASASASASSAAVVSSNGAVQLMSADNQSAAMVMLHRSIGTLTHELCHLFGLGHCVYYNCLICGSNCDAESERQPLFLCPIDLRKLAVICAPQQQTSHSKPTKKPTKKGAAAASAASSAAVSSSAASVAVPESFDLLNRYKRLLQWFQTNQSNQSVSQECWQRSWESECLWLSERIRSIESSPHFPSDNNHHNNKSDE